MKKILITGATGNIGKEVINYISKFNTELELIVASRNIESTKKVFLEKTWLSYRTFDFENEKTFEDAFSEIDILFLLRPPHISEVEKYFKPLLVSAQKNGIKNIVFLSVQGAEKSKVIPHNKIEALIKSLNFYYIFVRPSYFMQNLTTTLLPEILNTQSITLPTGNAKFNWIDVKNIGETSAILIKEFEQYKNKAYEITGTENLSFSEVTKVMSEVLKINIRFKSINPVSFYLKKKKEGIESGFALVMTILHFLPRLQKEPVISNNYNLITGKNTTTIKEFIEREKKLLFTKS